ncbi:quinone oxidoreductase PIG3-like [Halichondria panicea]|uniref:quinone oxidoreductase PIG3-like n=1 Tax=Halichondria panicea TaxID=6063 RepID=UPI00312BB7A9
MLVCKAVTFFAVIFQMRSIGYNSFDSSLHLQTDTEKPSLKEGDVLIKVEAAGVNRLDLIQVGGKFPPPQGESDILGVEVAGTVVEMTQTASEQTSLKTGDRVMALVGGGGYAEFCRAPYQVVMAVPEGVTWTEAAGIPENYLTAYQALVWNGRLKDGETVLIHAGGSGVGMAAAQLAKNLCKGVQVIVTAGSDEKLSVCKENGADFGINYKTDNFALEVMKFTNNKGADVILDFVGAPYWEKHSQCVAIDGRIIHLGFLGGSVLEKANLGVELKKRVTHFFSTLRSRSLEYRGELVKQFARDTLPLFSAGSAKVRVDSVHSAENATLAHTRMRENKNIGKIIITMTT